MSDLDAIEEGGSRVADEIPSIDSTGDSGIPMHLSPLGLIIGFIAGLRNLAFAIAALLFGSRNSETAQAFVIPGILGILLISLFFQWLAWRRFTYTVGEEDIRVESGILNRNARSIPYERIQDVSIEQKLLPRIFGLGEVKFETGSGEGEDGKLAYVSVAEGERLRDLIRDHKDGITPAIRGKEQEELSEGTVRLEREVEDEPIFAMDIKRIFTFGLFEFSLVIFAVLFGVAQQFEFILPFDLYDVGHWLGMVENSGVDLNAISWGARIFGAMAALSSLIAIGLFTGVIRTFIREYGFRLDRTAKGFRRRRGLTTLTDVAMPAHRVQAAIIQTGFWRKRFGWYALKFVSLAQDNAKEDSHVVAPFAQREEIAPIIQQADINAPGEDMKMKRFDGRWWLDEWLMIMPFIMVGIIPVLIFTEASWQVVIFPILAAIIGFFVWLNWRSHKIAVDDTQLYHAKGWWAPRVMTIPKVKVQSVEIHQGPIARLRGLAELRLGIAGGNLEMHGLKHEEAVQLRSDILAEVVKVDFSAVNRG